MNFKNKTALITGAAVGIGRATAILFAQNGANLVLADINKEKLEALKEELAQYTNNVQTFECDVSDEKRVYEVVKKGIDAFGSIDILVNNAALWRYFIPFVETPVSMWKDIIDINVMGTVYFTQAVLPKMIENGYGRIINVASVAGVYGNRNMSAYSATKGAIISLTKSIAKEVADKGILVNSVSPGTVSPSNNDDLNYYEDCELSYLGRTGTDMENANLICFLAGDNSGYISGQNIQIDGCRKKL